MSLAKGDFPVYLFALDRFDVITLDGFAISISAEILAATNPGRFREMFVCSTDPAVEARAFVPKVVRRARCDRLGEEEVVAGEARKIRLDYEVRAILRADGVPFEIDTSGEWKP